MNDKGKEEVLPTSDFAYHRLVVKLGTNLLCGGTDHLDSTVMTSLVRQIATLNRFGLEQVLVSSGAIASGRHKLGITKKFRGIPYKQVLASVGQSSLMHTYEQLFGQHDIIVAQALLTKKDLLDRSGYLNARNTLLTLMELGVITIVNENDVVATDEIQDMRFGDNDNLSAMVANMVNADLLVILTDTGGLYTADPHLYPDALLIPQVDEIDEEIEKVAGNTSGSRGTGGMMTKLEAARLATASGVSVVIAGGRESESIVKIARGERLGTFFPAKVSKMESRKRWILSRPARRGKIIVDAGAAQAIKDQEGSLLPAGVKAVEGKFLRGDVVDILDQGGECVGCGIVSYGSVDIERLKGARSSGIADILGYDFGAEVVHRNNLVVY